MNTFSFINTFYNMIYANEQVIVRELFSDFDYFFELRHWLNHQDIIIPSFNLIDLEAYGFLNDRMHIKDVDHVLHIPFSSDLEEFKQRYISMTHVLFIPKMDSDYEENSLELNKENVCTFVLNQSFSKDDLSFFDPFPAFLCAMTHVEKWPGALIFNENEEGFYPIRRSEDYTRLVEILDFPDVFERLNINYEDTYYLHLSDLHLGPDKAQKGLNQLYNSLDTLVPFLHSSHKLKVLLTGDLMDSPNRKNMYLANDFMNTLKKNYKADVTFILGNHDMIVHGFNIGKMQKSKVVAYLLGESIKVIEDDKIVIIKVDSTSHGNLARGIVGKRQLKEIDDELDTIENLEEYTLLVMVHHHVYPISKADFLKTKWREKFVLGKIVETSKVLVDASDFITWLNKHQIQYVLHGHKHLPYFNYKENRYIISAGSATGGLKENKSKYISFNLLKYDHETKRMKSCLIFYDDKQKAERQRVEVYLFDEGK